MEYLKQIVTIHGAALFVLMIVSIAAMGRIFALLADLRRQATAVEELVPHLRASLSARNFTRAAVAAASNDGSIGRLMAAVLSEPTRDPHRMRLIYKVNIDTELRMRLANLAPLRGLATIALLLGILGGIAAYAIGMNNPAAAATRGLVVGFAGVVVFLYATILYIALKRREIELNDAVAVEALKLIDTITRAEEELAG
jgi:hypothetical protein